MPCSRKYKFEYTNEQVTDWLNEAVGAKGRKQPPWRAPVQAVWEIVPSLSEASILSFWDSTTDI